LLNLALNARDAMPGGGEIAFRTGIVQLPMAGAQPVWVGEAENPHPGAYLLLEVADSGTGMGEAVRRRIFEPFFTTKPVGKGTGLGLPSVLGTVRTHRGRIALETAEGRGTTFRLLLPLAAAPGERAPAKGPAPDRGVLTVLVVDDDSPVREIMRDMLLAGGHAVLEASHGREALDLQRSRGKGIDLVILDMMMPDMDGSEVFAALRKHDPGVRVIISTGFPADPKIPTMLSAGAKGLLRKPYEKALLDKMMAAAMA
jgi:CheY-like chemotaxis protein